MSSFALWSALQALAALGALGLLAWALHTQRANAEAQRQINADVREIARLQAAASESLRSAVESARLAQELALRPVLRLSLEVRGLIPDVGHTPVVFAGCVANVGHGTAIVERVRLAAREIAHLDYTTTAGSAQQQLEEQFDRDLFRSLSGAKLTDLSAHLTLTPLLDSNRALEVGGRVDLFRLQVFAHNADLVEEACRGLGISVQYRSLTGACFDASEQFSGLRRLPNPPVRGLRSASETHSSALDDEATRTS
ncbi:MAG TPA: hypothetical protein VME21_01080 [Steroidobacteraceae bacterium]|nr:hypothetical protein [Steroidobacteraceae bacterium]